MKLFKMEADYILPDSKQLDIRVTYRYLPETHDAEVHVIEICAEGYWFPVHEETMYEMLNNELQETSIENQCLEHHEQEIWKDA